MTPDEREKYVRWQDYRITQFSFAINLFLTFAVAALGFSFALIKEAAFIPPPGSGWLLRHAIYGLAASIVFGTLTTLSRLLDFRCTTIKIKKKYSDWRQSAAEFLAKWLGPISWSLFYVQLAALAYGACRLACAILMTYGAKLAR
ncbi:MAG: hypothetical protein DME97_01005 [Verrucomicrobia bacterium]|nr:MAG: hypothetical protein DME97_01005 [Verrucomicrobiota bacterium]